MHFRFHTQAEMARLARNGRLNVPFGQITGYANFAFTGVERICLQTSYASSKRRAAMFRNRPPPPSPPSPPLSPPSRDASPELRCTDEAFLDDAVRTVPTQETPHRLAKAPKTAPPDSDVASTLESPPESPPPRKRRGRPPKNPCELKRMKKARGETRRAVSKRLDFERVPIDDGSHSPRTESGDADGWSDVPAWHGYLSRMNRSIGISRTISEPDPVDVCAGFDADECAMLCALFGACDDDDIFDLASTMHTA